MEDNANRNAATRENETEDHKKSRLDEQRKRQSDHRFKESGEQTQNRRLSDAKAHSDKR